ncbi:MAG: NAD-dependent epimerase/dehydratase family protein, partial [Chloroflexota bacterium]
MTLEGTRHIMEAAAAHKAKVILTSSITTYSVKIQTDVSRPGNVYGPRSGQWVVAALAELKRGTPTLIGGGNGDCGFVHVDNLIDSMLLAAEHPNAVGRI